jgi:hypothetical protein
VLIKTERAKYLLGHHKTGRDHAQGSTGLERIEERPQLQRVSSWSAAETIETTETTSSPTASPASSPTTKTTTHTGTKSSTYIASLKQAQARNADKRNSLVLTRMASLAKLRNAPTSFAIDKVPSKSRYDGSLDGTTTDSSPEPITNKGTRKSFNRSLGSLMNKVGGLLPSRGKAALDGFEHGDGDYGAAFGGSLKEAFQGAGMRDAFHAPRNQMQDASQASLRLSFADVYQSTTDQPAAKIGSDAGNAGNNTGKGRVMSSDFGLGGLMQAVGGLLPSLGPDGKAGSDSEPPGSSGGGFELDDSAIIRGVNPAHRSQMQDASQAPASFADVYQAAPTTDQQAASGTTTGTTGRNQRKDTGSVLPADSLVPSRRLSNIFSGSRNSEGDAGNSASNEAQGKNQESDHITMTSGAQSLMQSFQAKEGKRKSIVQQQLAAPPHATTDST